MSRKTLKSREGGYLISIIGDEDTATGFLLAGVGENQANSGSNYFVVDPSTSNLNCMPLFQTPLFTHHLTDVLLLLALCIAEETPTQAIEDAFKRLTERDDIAIVLINQYVCFVPLHSFIATVRSNSCVLHLSMSCHPALTRSLLSPYATFCA